MKLSVADEDGGRGNAKTESIDSTPTLNARAALKDAAQGSDKQSCSASSKTGRTARLTERQLLLFCWKRGRHDGCRSNDAGAPMRNVGLGGFLEQHEER